MSVSATQAAALQALLEGDAETFDRLSSQAAVSHSTEFAVLTATAFTVAAGRRFPPGWSDSDVIRFVGELRSRDQGAHADVSARAAEQMLLGVLRGSTCDDESELFAKGYAQIAVLAELVRNLDRTELAALLAEVRALTDRWLATRAIC